jgi:hypothetical protein
VRPFHAGLKNKIKCKCSLLRGAFKSKYILAITLHKWQNQNMFNGNLFLFIIVKYTTYEPKSNSHTFCKEKAHSKNYAYIKNITFICSQESKFITKWNSAAPTTIKKIIFCYKKKSYTSHYHWRLLKIKKLLHLSLSLMIAKQKLIPLH